MSPKALASLTIPALAVGIYALWPEAPLQPAPSPAPAVVAQADPAEAEPKVTVPPVEVDLAMAVEQKSVAAEFHGNGRDEFSVRLMNKGATPLRVEVPLGQMFEAEFASPVIVVQGAAVVVEPGRTRELELRTAAVRSTGKVAPATFHLSYTSMPKLEPLLRKLHQHPEINHQALQTAVLALTENLPLSAVAKFTMASGGLPSRFNTDAFRVDTCELVGALVLLRELGVKEASLALTIDPQLKIEGMIDPATRPLAMRYYGIQPEAEWEFWRKELLQGEPSTRHYALYGIARFYPDVALQMLPRWARETRTNPVYRLSAVQALADTQRSEALPLLRELAVELGANTELAKAANGAAAYLDYQLAQVAANRNGVAFRNSRKSNEVARN